MRLLGYRSRSRKELALRLRRKGFEEAEIEAAFTRLERCGYLDDAALAAGLRRQALETKTLGRGGARAFMLQRGISASTADEALAGYDEREGALKAAKKKLKALSGLSNNIKRRRLASALRRRGFSAGTIRETLRNEEVLPAEEETDEE